MLNRRTFLRAGASLGLGLLTPLNAVSQTPRVRRDIKAIKGTARLDDLKDVFGHLRAEKNRKQIDQVTSWWFQAAVHSDPSRIDKGSQYAEWKKDLVDLDTLRGSEADKVSKYFHKCEQHHSKTDAAAPAKHFLSWHRMYLFYFEDVLRSFSRFSDFALPYWDSASDSSLPEACRQPQTEHNPLFIKSPARYQHANKGETLGEPGDFSDKAALDSGTFDELTKNLEDSPHEQGHGLIGDAMRSPGYAAFDPMFWLHHANIDRLWWQWQEDRKAKDASSYGADWLGDSFTFLTMAGEQTENVSKFLDTANIRVKGGQPYIYERPLGNGPGTAISRALEKPPLVVPVINLPIQAPLGQPVPPPVQEKPLAVSLTRKSSTLRVHLPAIKTNENQIPGSAEKSSGKIAAATLTLVSVKLTEVGTTEGFVYDVYVNLPEESSPRESRRPYKVGSFGPWKLNCRDPNMCVSGGGVVVRFSIKSARVLDTLKWGQTADVSFVRLGTGGGQSYANEPLVNIQSVTIEAI
ncbi:MAG: tyrosinase family protein [Panacagrimonas sp.]